MGEWLRGGMVRVVVEAGSVGRGLQGLSGRVNERF